MYATLKCNFQIDFILIPLCGERPVPFETQASVGALWFFNWGNSSECWCIVRYKIVALCTIEGEAYSSYSDMQCMRSIIHMAVYVVPLKRYILAVGSLLNRLVIFSCPSFSFSLHRWFVRLSICSVFRFFLTILLSLSCSLASNAFDDVFYVT